MEHPASARHSLNGVDPVSNGVAIARLSSRPPPPLGVVVPAQDFMGRVSRIDRRAPWIGLVDEPWVDSVVWFLVATVLMAGTLTGFAFKYDVDHGLSQWLRYAASDLELLVKQSDVDVPIFPSTTLHVGAALDRALA